MNEPHGRARTPIGEKRGVNGRNLPNDDYMYFF